MSLTADLQVKHERLCRILSEMESVVVGYSGGVDSAVLAKVAHAVLADRALAVTARSASLPARELKEAREVAAQAGFPHLVIDTEEVSDPRYAANPANRCFYCKSELFGKLKALAAQLGFRWLAYGENWDDRLDHRPGAVAARENRVRSPLAEAELAKPEIRALALHLGLRVWNKPAFACLSSRFPYGMAITPQRLAQVERAEDCLRELGFRQYRVRCHGEVARIEVDRDEQVRLLELSDVIHERLREAGFTYVTADLQGYRRGSMNEAAAPPAP